jgi:hypothetical protein
VEIEGNSDYLRDTISVPGASLGQGHEERECERAVAVRTSSKDNGSEVRQGDAESEIPSQVNFSKSGRPKS